MRPGLFSDLAEHEELSPVFSWEIASSGIESSAGVRNAVREGPAGSWRRPAHRSNSADNLSVRHINFDGYKRAVDKAAVSGSL